MKRAMRFISIMFEMKNEADDSVNRKTNESHFKELDADRKKKNCEYAVLVSLLEPENELYNAGITGCVLPLREDVCDPTAVLHSHHHASAQRSALFAAVP